MPCGHRRHYTASRALPCVLLLRTAAGAPHATLPPLCDGCLPEPVEVDYFGATRGKEPPRVRWHSLQDKGKAAFMEAALRGQALIIENATDGMAMAGWSCERFAQEFPSARMRREYDWVTNPNDNSLQTMGSQDWIGKRIAGEDAAERLKDDALAPPFAPFYWGVREHRNGKVGDQKTVKRVRDLIVDTVPHFMQPENGPSMFENSEFWLGANGTGARAHMDSHCISTLSFVLSGERRWRIGPVPRMPRGAGRSKDGEVFFDDGVAYQLDWRPMFEFTIREGEALLFPPGWIHETLNTDPGCTVALTTQFDIPRPARYWRSYYPRLRRVGDLHACWKEMRTSAALGDKKSPPKGQAELLEYASALFDRRKGTFSQYELAFHDTDGDGTVSKDEFLKGFVEWTATERAIKKEKPSRKIRPDMSLKVPGGARGTQSDEL